MCMKLTITFTDGHSIIVRLHDSMKRWAQHVQKISNKYKYSLNSGQSAIGTSDMDNESIKVTKVYKILSDTVGELEHVRPIGFVLPEKFTHDQEVLNRLHRYYTDSAAIVDQGSELFKLVSKINYCVHELEEYTSSRNTVYYGDLWFHIHDYPIPMDCWIDLKEQEKQNYKFFDYDYEYTVRLDRSILGKCVLQSFEENDDPNQKDCTGRIGSFGGFFIDTDKKLKDIYESKKFKDWCIRHGKQVNEWPLEFVIGHVEQFSDKPITFKNKILDKLNFEMVPSSIG